MSCAKRPKAPRGTEFLKNKAVPIWRRFVFLSVLISQSAFGQPFPSSYFTDLNVSKFHQTGRVEDFLQIEDGSIAEMAIAEMLYNQFQISLGREPSRGESGVRYPDYDEILRRELGDPRGQRALELHHLAFRIALENGSLAGLAFFSRIGGNSQMLTKKNVCAGLFEIKSSMQGELGEENLKAADAYDKVITLLKLALESGLESVQCPDYANGNGSPIMISLSKAVAQLGVDPQKTMAFARLGLGVNASRGVRSQINRKSVTNKQIDAGNANGSNGGKAERDGRVEVQCSKRDFRYYLERGFWNQVAKSSYDVADETCVFSAFVEKVKDNEYILTIGAWNIFERQVKVPFFGDLESLFLKLHFQNDRQK